MRRGGGSAPALPSGPTDDVACSCILQLKTQAEQVVADNIAHHERSVARAAKLESIAADQELQRAERAEHNQRVRGIRV